MRLCALLGVFISINYASPGLEISFSKKLEEELLKGYNSKHRPVKSESTTVQVQIFISITHVEKVDEYEQTMMVHGHLWATWLDEYMTWDPSKYNGTEKINIDSWRLWQPALALYNSARGNSWYLYMNGMPAIVHRDGKDCPIVISDWVYDLSRVNLSDPGEMPWKNPLIKLNYDPQTAYEKKHVAGWEVFDTWRKHCYWGPHGCKEDLPEGQPEWYWSLLEFGVRLKRHAPYLGIMIVLPTIVACFANLLTFWVDTWDSAISMLVANIVVQGIFGWDLIRQLPPGSGNIPRIVLLYGMNLFLTSASFFFHVLFCWLTTITPANVTLPYRFEIIPEKLRMKKFFELKGLSFDPQTLLEAEQQAEEGNNYHSPIASIQSSNAFDEQSTSDTENLISLENAGDQANSSNATEVSISLEDDHAQPKVDSSEIKPADNLEKQLYLIRRVMFCVYAAVYLLVIPYGIL